MTRARRGLLRGAGLLGLLALLPALPPRAASAEESKPSVVDEARKEAIERLRRDLRKMATGPYAAAKKEEIVKDVEALTALGGADAAKASLDGLAFDDADVETKIFSLIETSRDKSLVAPLSALVEHKDYRRRFPLHARIARALSVIGDHSGIPTLTGLVGSEEAKVVAAAADALATFKSAPHAKRVEPVRRMIEVYESTWNRKEGFKVANSVREAAIKDWEVYGMALRKSLQALTGQTGIAQPRQFRDWWNDHKKDTDW